YFVIDAEPDAELLRGHPKVVKIVERCCSINAVRTSMDLPISQDVIRTVEKVRPAVKLPTMGGSLPLELIEKTLETHMIMIHMTNPDNRIHGSNENLRLQNLWDGIEVMAALLLM